MIIPLRRDNIDYILFLLLAARHGTTILMNPETLMVFFGGGRKMVSFDVFDEISFSGRGCLTFIPLALKHGLNRGNGGLDLRDMTIEEMFIKIEKRRK
jgi:hypothetical protein